MKNLLITGGAGFIGANFVHHLLATYPDYHAVVFDKLTYAGNPNNLKPVENNPRYHFVQGDICDAEAVRAAIREHDIDTVVNWAAETHVDRSILDPDAFVRTNVHGPYVLCEAVKDLKLERLHHISSVTGDTPLLVRDARTSEVALRPIETLDGEDLRHYCVLTVDAEQQVRFMQMRDFIKHPVDELYEITYSGGGSIRATAEHSVFVFDGLDIVAKPSSDIQPGDLLVTFLGDVESSSRRPHCFEFRSLLEDYNTSWLAGSLDHRRAILALAGEPVRAAQLLTTVTQKPCYRVINELIEEGHLSAVGSLYHITKQGIADAATNMVATRWNMVKRQLHLPYDQLEVTPLLMRVFGLYVAEGHAAHTMSEQKRHMSSVTFTIARDELDELALLKRCAEEVFGIHAYVQEHESTYQVTYNSAWVHRLFRQFGATAETKHLPAWIWTQPRELVHEFFRGYEGDARIRPDGSRCFTSVNRELIEQLVWLGRLNDINTRMSRRVVQQIAGVVPPGCTVTRARTFFDLSVSADHARADEAATWRSPIARCLPAQPIRATLQKGPLAETLRRKKLVSKGRLVRESANGAPIPERIMRLANSPLGVAGVRSVKRIEGDFMVYDVSVPGGERFFGGNVPVLLHNTDEVYGPIPEGKFKETDRFKPTSPYAAAKAGGELLVLSYFMTYHLPITVTRGVNTYGRYQYPEKQIPLFVTNAIDNLPLPLYGDGRQIRDRLHALDHARAVDVVLHHGQLGEAYNVSADMERTNLEVTELMLEILEKPRSLIQPILDRPAHDVRYALDSSKLRALGWRPQVDFDTGFADTVRWYQENEWWWRPLKSGEYLDYYRRQYTDRAQTLKDEVGGT